MAECLFEYMQNLEFYKLSNKQQKSKWKNNLKMNRKTQQKMLVCSLLQRSK